MESVSIKLASAGITKSLRAAANDYPYIYAWQKATGSDASYIINLTACAAREKAPKTAIYRASKDWKTLENLPADHDMRALMEEYIAALKESAPPVMDIEEKLRDQQDRTGDDSDNHDGSDDE